MVKRFICHISNIIICLINCEKEVSGYCIANNNSNIDYINELHGWVYILNDNFKQVIKMMNNFKVTDKDGKGEFFWSIINTQIVFNSKKHADVLYFDNTLGEIKFADSASTCGRLLFKRDNWFGYNDSKTYYDVVMNNLNSFCLINNLKLNLTEFFPDVHAMSYNAGYLKLISYVKTINKDIANKLIHYIFYMTIDKTSDQFFTYFKELDLTEENNFKLFHFVNYCLYYIL